MSKPKGHTSPKIDTIAANLLRNSPSAAVRSIAGAALSDTNLPAHTRDRAASLAGSLMHTGNKNERRVAASVLADHKTTRG